MNITVQCDKICIHRSHGINAWCAIFDRKTHFLPKSLVTISEDGKQITGPLWLFEKKGLEVYAVD